MLSIGCRSFLCYSWPIYLAESPDIFRYVSVKKLSLKINPLIEAYAENDGSITVSDSKSDAQD